MTIGIYDKKMCFEFKDAEDTTWVILDHFKHGNEKFIYFDLTDSYFKSKFGTEFSNLVKYNKLVIL